jgi:hypothetical protein
MAGIECLRIDRNTELSGFLKELKWNDVFQILPQSGNCARIDDPKPEDCQEGEPVTLLLRYSWAFGNMEAKGCVGLPHLWTSVKSRAGQRFPPPQSLVL